MLKNLYRTQALIPLLLAVWFNHSQAQDLARIQAGSINQTEMEVMVPALVPEAERDRFWVSPDGVKRFARSLAVQRQLAAQAVQSGIDQDPVHGAYVNIMREQALMQAYLQQRSLDAIPDDAALESLARSEYKADPKRFVTPEQLRVRHILLPVAEDGSNSEQVKNQAQSLLEQLKQGADFAQLAQEHSSDKKSASQGGELDWFERGRMVLQFDNAAFALEQPGARSEPVKTRFGWHIIELLERKPAQQMPIEDVIPKLKDTLKARIAEDERRRLWGAAEESVELDEEALKTLMGKHFKLINP